jgi:hypothetical protein
VRRDLLAVDERTATRRIAQQVLVPVPGNLRVVTRHVAGAKVQIRGAPSTDREERFVEHDQTLFVRVVDPELRFGHRLPIRAATIS